MSGVSSNSPQPHPSEAPKGQDPYQGVNWSPAASIWVTVVSFFVAQIVAGIILGIVLGFLHWTEPDIVDWLSTTPGQFSFVVIAEALTVSILVWYLRRRKASFRALGFHRDIAAGDLAAALAGFAIYFLLLIGAMIVSQYAFRVDVNQQQDLGFNSVATRPEMVMAFVSLVILPPLVEEVVFRGFLFGGLRKRLPFGGAMVLTSLLFAAPHLLEAKGGGLLWVAAVDTFVLSLVLCYLREKTGNLWASIIVHAIKNGWAFMTLFVFVH